MCGGKVCRCALIIFKYVHCLYRSYTLTWALFGTSTIKRSTIDQYITLLLEIIFWERRGGALLIQSRFTCKIFQSLVISPTEL